MSDGHSLPDESPGDADVLLDRLDQEGRAQVLVPFAEDPSRSAELLVRALELLAAVRRERPAMRAAATEGSEIGKPEFEVALVAWIE